MGRERARECEAFPWQHVRGVFGPRSEERRGGEIKRGKEKTTPH